jgi:hypothetical protein
MVAQTRLSVTSTYIAFLVAEEKHVSPGFRTHKRVSTIRSYEKIHMLHSDLNDAMLKTLQLSLKRHALKHMTVT